MTQTTHTPGPWAFTDEMYGLDHMRVYGVNDHSGQGVANCGYGDSGEAQANARLIAAAPDLLAACRYMLSEDVTGGSIHWQGNTHTALAMMERAVAKATGTEEDEHP